MKGKYINDQYLIIDWGTTNFRVFLMDHNGELLKKKETSMGLLKVKESKNNDDKFALALTDILKSWLPTYQELPIFMAGMIGSVNGWHSVEYVSTNANIEKLINKAYHFNLPWNACAFITPGISHLNKRTYANDVMRGEEVQVFGLLKKLKTAEITAILPGTHSKHVVINDGEISSISSFMTGELFSIVNQYSILGKNLPKQVFHHKSFIKGVKEGQTTQLTQTLFQARTHNLFGIIEIEHIESYLSGLLIGNELQAVTSSVIYLVGSHSLCEKYQLACKSLNIEAKYFNGDECFLLGMESIVKALDSSIN